MSKIGTAHVEIKPVLNDQAMADVVERIETALENAFERATGHRQTFRIYEPDGSVTKVEGVLAMSGNELGIYPTNPHANAAASRGVPLADMLNVIKENQ